MSIWQQVEDEFKCNHPKSDVRCKNDSVNRSFFVAQCLRCGQAITSALPKSSLPKDKFYSPFDYDLEAKWQQAKRNRQRELQQKQDEQFTNKQIEWFDDYNHYLQSPQWKEKRRKVLDRDKRVCQACLERKATQVHHLTYAHVFHEPLFELVAVCEKCHDELTQLDSQRRNNNGVTNAHSRSTVS